MSPIFELLQKQTVAELHAELKAARDKIANLSKSSLPERPPSEIGHAKHDDSLALKEALQHLAEAQLLEKRHRETVHRLEGELAAMNKETSANSCAQPGSGLSPNLQELGNQLENTSQELHTCKEDLIKAQVGMRQKESLEREVQRLKSFIAQQDAAVERLHEDRSKVCCLAPLWCIKIIKPCMLSTCELTFWVHRPPCGTLCFEHLLAIFGCMLLPSIAQVHIIALLWLLVINAATNIVNPATFHDVCPALPVFLTCKL